MFIWQCAHTNPHSLCVFVFTRFSFRIITTQFSKKNSWRAVIYWGARCHESADCVTYFQKVCTSWFSFDGVFWWKLVINFATAFCPIKHCNRILECWVVNRFEVLSFWSRLLFYKQDRCLSHQTNVEYSFVPFTYELFNCFLEISHWLTPYSIHVIRQSLKWRFNRLVKKTRK